MNTPRDPFRILEGVLSAARNLAECNIDQVNRRLRDGLCTPDDAIDYVERWNKTPRFSRAAYMGGKIVLLPLNDDDAKVAEDPRA